MIGHVVGALDLLLGRPVRRGYASTAWNHGSGGESGSHSYRFRLHFLDLYRDLSITPDVGPFCDIYFDADARRRPVWCAWSHQADNVE
jgi:hypothetical protein